jgi:hypothetical protein
MTQPESVSCRFVNCLDLEKVSDMLRRSFVCLMVVASIGFRIEAQETSYGAASNGNADLEQCCRRKNNKTGDGKAGAFDNAAIGVFRGKLKQLSNKEIVIENESKQMVSIRRSHKTKFLRNNQKIKPSDIDLEAPVTIDVSETANVGLLAINVKVDLPPTKADPK